MTHVHYWKTTEINSLNKLWNQNWNPSPSHRHSARRPPSTCSTTSDSRPRRSHSAITTWRWPAGRWSPESPTCSTSWANGARSSGCMSLPSRSTKGRFPPHVVVSCCQSSSGNLWFRWKWNPTWYGLNWLWTCHSLYMIPLNNMQDKLNINYI